ELLLNRRRYAGKFLEIVGDPARPRQRLKTKLVGLGRQFLGDDRLGLRAYIHAVRALRPRNAIDRGLSNKIAIQRDGAAGVVVAGDDIGDAVRIAIGVDDGRYRNPEATRFLERDVLFV